ncbi:MAG: hypothetical protein EPN79_15795 [Burkholderiaceae bacterium]|nr:MAG: hypothetical protein EPN79_15795 [Burkholderiaceae bacterium]
MNASTLRALVVACAVMLGARHAHASDVVAPEPSIVSMIHADYRAQHDRFPLPTVKAVRQLDDMLLSQYGATGRISAEPNAELKGLFYEAATLLMNGYPIAGGTLVNMARHRPAMASSPAGQALGRFVDGMLTPTGEDDAELIAYQRRTQAAMIQLTRLPAALQVPAQVQVLGEIYDDAIAVDAGKKALAAAGLSSADVSIVQSARTAAARITVPQGH